MSVRAAITVNKPQEQIESRWAEAEPPLSEAEASYLAAPGNRGTELRVVLDKTVPGGVLGGKIAAVMGTDPQRQLEDALRRFKQLLETGQVLRSDAQHQ